ncbi:Hypothetical predicted protein [Octopus vulgaris]|uniref:Uncharacterized protein n=1 Tax=Octopus vulgaris TaxID=6645 RepID=A0AA36AQW4_OCTVU|nr:Hypothetical predicted protein [Octopus vulgaris]
MNQIKPDTSSITMESMNNAKDEPHCADCDDDCMELNDQKNENDGADCEDLDISDSERDDVTNTRLESLHLQHSLQNQFDTRKEPVDIHRSLFGSPDPGLIYRLNLPRIGPA